MTLLNFTPLCLWNRRVDDLALDIIKGVPQYTFAADYPFTILQMSWDKWILANRCHIRLGSVTDTSESDSVGVKKPRSPNVFLNYKYRSEAINFYIKIILLMKDEFKKPNLMLKNCWNILDSVVSLTPQSDYAMSMTLSLTLGPQWHRWACKRHRGDFCSWEDLCEIESLFKNTLA